MGEESIDKSGYNEAAFKMARINECQKRINWVNNNLVAFYYEFNGYGYIVKRTEIENLMSEVWGKLDKINKDKVNQYKELLTNAMNEWPVHLQRQIQGIDGAKKISKLSIENFKKISRLMFDIHMYVNELLEAAGYSTFTVEADNPNDPYN